MPAPDHGISGPEWPGSDATRPDYDRPGRVRPAVPGNTGCAVWPAHPRPDGKLSQARRTDGVAGAVPGGGWDASWRRSADGGIVGPACGSRDAFGPRFDGPVPPGGYAWWYVDALSDDGRHGLTIIAFIGSVFSPYYAWSRRRGAGIPQNHVAVNAVLYRPGGSGKRWAMTERGAAALTTDAHRLQIGPSALTWDGTTLTIALDEVALPLPRRLRGTIRVHPGALTSRAFTLDAAGRHRWSPLAPVSRVEVALTHPELRWSGPGYFDTNEGDTPLEDDFRHWDWCRAPTAAGATILYNAERRDGSSQALALRVARNGAVEAMPPPARRRTKSG